MPTPRQDMFEQAACKTLSCPGFLAQGGQGSVRILLELPPRVLVDISPVTVQVDGTAVAAHSILGLLPGRILHELR